MAPPVSTVESREKTNAAKSSNAQSQSLIERKGWSATAPANDLGCTCRDNAHSLASTLGLRRKAATRHSYAAGHDLTHG
jgi:hypothetical protein